MSLVHRYYDPATGQFLTVDPDVAATGQPYAYTDDDPVNWLDPLGLSWYDPSWAHKAIHRFARGAAKVGHFVSTHKQAVITAATIIATLPLDETGIGEAIDADVIAGDATADVTADAVSDEAANEAAAEGAAEGADQIAYQAPDSAADGTSVFRTPSLGDGQSELEDGLNPASHLEGDQSAYVGTENVARDFADPKIGGYENGYIRFDMADEFENEFSQYNFPYTTATGEIGSEWQIPASQIGRFNELTLGRTWIPFS